MDAFPIRYSPRLYWFFWPLLLGTRHSEVRLAATDLHVRMGWAFDATIPRASIRAAGPWREWPWAIGVHGNFRGAWLVNGSATGIVGLAIDPPARGRMAGFPITLRWLGLGLRDPAGFLTALGVPPMPEGAGPSGPDRDLGGPVHGRDPTATSRRPPPARPRPGPRPAAPSRPGTASS